MAGPFLLLICSIREELSLHGEFAQKGPPLVFQELF